MVNIIKLPSSFYMEAGFKTKKHALKVIRDERKRQKLNFNTYDEEDFFYFISGLAVAEELIDIPTQEYIPVYREIHRRVRKLKKSVGYQVDLSIPIPTHLYHLAIELIKKHRDIKTTSSFVVRVKEQEQVWDDEAADYVYVETVGHKTISAKAFAEAPAPLSINKKELEVWLNDAVSRVMAGSDPTQIFQEIEPTFYRIDTVLFSGGSDIPKIEHRNKKAKTKIIEAFVCQDFPSANNNCLLEIVRAIYGIKKTANKLREELNIDDGTIDIATLPKIEEYIGKKIAVLVGSELKLEIKKRGKPNNLSAKNIRNFETTVKHNNVYVYGHDECDLFVFLQNEHYSFIKKRLESFYCPISGLPVSRKGRTMPIATIRRLFLANGTLVKDADTIEPHKYEDNKNKPYRYWFFDYETIYDKLGFLVPYSVACIVGSLNENNEFILEHKFFNMSEDCNSLFIDFLLANKDYNHKNILVGYNNSRFDNFLLTEGLLKYELLSGNSVFKAGNSILQLKFETFKTIDLCRFVMQPLKKACEGFRCDTQKGFLEHQQVQAIYESCDDFSEFFTKMEKYRDTIGEYNVKDCASLQELFFKVRKTCKELIDEELNENMTISGMTYNAWAKTNHGVCAAKNYENWKFIKKAMYAGRSQIFRRGKFLGEFQSMDVKSLYPFVMMECEYPIGQEIETDAEVIGKMGLYNVKIIKQPNPNIIPLRTDTAPLDWTYENEFGCVLSSVDIDTLRRHGAEIEVGGGIYWDQCSKDVFSFFTSLKAAKTRQDQLKEAEKCILSLPFTNTETVNEIMGENYYNASEREMSKLTQNSLSGKVGQRLFDDDSKLIFNEKDAAKFIDNHIDIDVNTLMNSEAILLTGTKKDIDYKPEKAKPNHLCVFIYSWARTHMYDAVISKVPERIAMDTDSLHAPISAFARLEQKPGFGNFHVGDQYGDFEGELDFKTKAHYAVAPKCYTITPVEGQKDKDQKDVKPKMRFKGIGKNDKLAENINEKEFKKLPLKKQAELYATLKPALCEQLYANLIDGKPVYIICSQIKKITVEKDKESGDSHYARLKQIFLFKEIKP